MPNSTEHRDKHALNRALLNAGFAATNPEWAAVVAFYAAVHLIERLAAAEPRGPIHHRTHTARYDYLRAHRRHRVLRRHYERLQEASEVSRYETVARFNAQYAAATVQSVLIDTHLVAIEDYVTTYFAPPPPPPSVPGPTATGS